MASVLLILGFVWFITGGHLSTSEVTELTIGRQCVSHSECYGTEECLEDCYDYDGSCLENKTEINVIMNNITRTCRCGYAHFNDSKRGTCAPKKDYDEECEFDSICRPWFTECQKDDTGTRRCKCPKGHVYDRKYDMCSSIGKCPSDATYIHFEEGNVCHKVITSANETCGNAKDARPLMLDNDAFGHFVDSLWSYGFYKMTDNPCFGSTMIELSTNHLVNGKESTWYWSTGDVIPNSFGRYFKHQESSLLSSNENHKCLYLLYDGEDSQILTSESCDDIPGMFKGCTINMPSKFCDTDTDSGGYVWNFTNGGDTSYGNCPDGYEGLRTRYCTKQGVFKSPNDNCTLKVFADISKEFDNGVIDATSAIGKLANVTDMFSETRNNTNTTRLYIGDLLKISNILELAATQLSNDSNANITTTASDFMGVVSVLLDPEETGEQWQSQIENKNDGGASKLLSTVDTYAETLANFASENNETTLEVVKPNIALQFGTITDDNDSGANDEDNTKSFKGIAFPSEEIAEKLDTTKAPSSSLFLSKDALKGVKSFTSVLYTNLSKSLPNRLESSDGKGDKKKAKNTINSQVLSLQLFPKPPDVIEPPLVLTFQVFNKNQSSDAYIQNCAYWDQTALDNRGAWSTKGCERISSNSSVTVCNCKHLTNFAIIMSPALPSEEHMFILSIMSYVGCGISVVFLTITLVLNRMFWKYVKSDNALLTVILCFFLLLGYIAFLAGVTQTSPKGLCTFVAVLLHYIYLVIFFLMLAEGLVVVITVVFPFHKNSHIYQFLGLAFGVPALIVAISMAVTQLEGYGNDQFCWLSLDSGLIWAFVGPAALIILINFIIIVVVLKKMYGTTAMKNKTDKEKVMATSRMLAVLLPIMGSTWAIGVFSVNKQASNVIQYFFVILNSVQGLAIFIFHVLSNKQLQNAIKLSTERRATKESFQSELKRRVNTNTSTAESKSTSPSDMKSIDESGFESTGNAPAEIEENTRGRLSTVLETFGDTKDNLGIDVSLENDTEVKHETVVDLENDTKNKLETAVDLENDKLPSPLDPECDTKEAFGTQSDVLLDKKDEMKNRVKTTVDLVDDSINTVPALPMDTFASVAVQEQATKDDPETNVDSKDGKIGTLITPDFAPTGICEPRFDAKDEMKKGVKTTVDLKDGERGTLKIPDFEPTGINETKF